MIEFTPWAAEVIARSSRAAQRLNPDARLRLTSDGGVLSSTLTESPQPGDTELVVGEVAVIVAPGVTGLVDVEAPHDRVVLRPSGSPPNPRPE